MVVERNTIEQSFNDYGRNPSWRCPVFLKNIKRFGFATQRFVPNIFISNAIDYTWQLSTYGTYANVV